MRESHKIEVRRIVGQGALGALSAVVRTVDLVLMGTSRAFQALREGMKQMRQKKQGISWDGQHPVPLCVQGSTEGLAQMPNDSVCTSE